MKHEPADETSGQRGRARSKRNSPGRTAAPGAGRRMKSSTNRGSFKHLRSLGVGQYRREPRNKEGSWGLGLLQQAGTVSRGCPAGTQQQLRQKAASTHSTGLQRLNRKQSHQPLAHGGRSKSLPLLLASCKRSRLRHAAALPPCTEEAQVTAGDLGAGSEGEDPQCVCSLTR